MRAIRRLLDRLMTPEVPPKCPACRQDTEPLERVGPQRFWCVVCAKDFEAVREGDSWKFDMTPTRYKVRQERRAV